MKKIILSALLFSALLSCGKNESTNSAITTLSGNGSTVLKPIKPNEEPCETTTTIPTNLEGEYGCVNTKNLMQISLNDTYRIIQSQSEFNSLVTGSCLPNIDFNKYALIIGKKALRNGNRSIAYSLTRDCINNKMILNVTITNDLSATAPNITYHALVPKLNTNEQVVVNVTVQ
jgi:hypothetical protein